MESIQFSKDELRDLEFTLSREYLEANSARAYSSSTIINSHTRKYHGLLVVRQPQLGTDNYVLLSNLDETLVVESEAFALSSHQYPGVIEPQGYKLLDSFSLKRIPTWTYKIGKVTFKKELILAEGNNQLLLRYTLVKGKKVSLRLDPFTAFRRIHDLAFERELCVGFKEVPGGIQIKMDAIYDSLNLQFSKEVAFKHEPLWFYKNQYLAEKDRGYDFEEDLYRIGQFETVLNEGESIIMSASTDCEDDKTLKTLFKKSLKKKKELTNMKDVLNRAADQFISKTKRGTEVCAGFHWFGRWGRDTFIALPGLTIARGKPDLCMEIIDTMLEDLEGGLLTNIGVGDVKEYNSVDASLWFFWTLCELSDSLGDKAAVWNKYHVKMKEILDAYLAGTMYNIQMDEDGLITCGAEGVALTWMDAKVEGTPVTPRRGKPVEINALWYNAVAFSLDCAREVEDKKFVKEWSSIKRKIEKSFVDQFWDKKKGYLADVVSKENIDWSIRPNQVFSVSLPYPLISGKRAKKVLETVKNELYTSYGMRTLSPRDERYTAVYRGDQKSRDKSYHQGIIWPWLIGSYCEANLKTYGVEFLSEIQNINNSFALQFRKQGLGTVSELYHNDFDYEAVGTISQAWSVSELIRLNRLAEDYKQR